MPLFPIRNIHIGVVPILYITIDPKRSRDDKQKQNRKKLFRSLLPSVISVTVIEKVDYQRNQRIEEVRNHFRKIKNNRIFDKYPFFEIL